MDSTLPIGRNRDRTRDHGAAGGGDPTSDGNGTRPPRPLLVVDVQNGFVNDFTDAIPGRIERLLKRRSFDPVFFTRFINIPDGPYPRFLDWHSCAGPPETDLAPAVAPFAAADRVFDKPGFTGIPPALGERLRALGAEDVALAGIDTDMCVLKCAMDLFDLGLRPIVLVDCCASTAGLQAHLAGLAVLARNIGAEQLRETGLGEGYLGRPPAQPPVSDEARFGAL